ncbi:hypothetical protein [Pseudoxanthomonas sp. KAs_5_3]|uniref:hypothetical protein n=2 Tax=unclassified Pseudoxanthomonas TaxID=2645906 RepID=UPI0008EB89CE|nr:hypothetical protein [Pseudoxanthomonas sp. KAs_5_3]SFV28211.1 hypothetical protein SAMN05428990_0924 [Pseudoxanthomonas sp. YR558]
MKRVSPDAGRRRAMRTRRSCEGSVPGIAPLSTAGLLAMAMMAMGAATAPEALLALQDTAWYEAIPADDMRAG